MGLQAHVTATAGDAAAALPPKRVAGGLRRTGRFSSKFGTVNYSVDEMRRLNDKVRAVMPLVGEDWLHVAYQFNYMRPESIPYREVESLKRKFKKMYCARGASNRKLPDYIAEAKELRQLINQQSERAHVDQSDSHSEGEQGSELGTPHKSNQSTPTSAAATSASAAAVQAAANTTDAAVEAATSTNAAVRVDTDGGAQSTGHPKQLDANSEGVAGEELSGSEGEDSMRDISSKLREMEEDYHRRVEAKRDVGGSRRSASELNHTSSGNPSATSIHAPPSALQAHLQSPSHSTSSIISMLKRSVERRKRTIDEQMLSESERVRKERKKRKMEQVMLSIHQQQREKEFGDSLQRPESPAPPRTPPPLTSATLPAAAVALGPATTQSAVPTTPGLGSVPTVAIREDPTTTDSFSLNLMEVLLQFMMAQQQEINRRFEMEEERRQLERLQEEKRRLEDDARRRKDKQEMMLLMAALLGDQFPASLRHHLLPLEDQTTAASAATAEPATGSGLRNGGPLDNALI
ncbi:TPA: hypothetical protein N0F65_008057 [Lagenidium giganteum]|uniref:DUF6818 domain-containing protein n=1 Tax=Lagenidium giganteum TaxID=4803 RepID=A0AAV2YRY9_9STRA|nr:TPA: hypothetical protein N0F65_008057 [Lagenidium giganteum]